jgi:stress-induced morphogen
MTSEVTPTGSRIERIARRLRETLSPDHLEIRDDSAQHAGHAEVLAGDGSSLETHLHITIQAEAFRTQSRLERQRLVQSLIADEFQRGLHALSMECRVPGDRT